MMININIIVINDAVIKGGLEFFALLHYSVNFVI